MEKYKGIVNMIKGNWVIKSKSFIGNVPLHPEEKTKKLKENDIIIFTICEIYSNDPGNIGIKLTGKICWDEEKNWNDIKKSLYSIDGSHKKENIDMVINLLIKKGYSVPEKIK